MINDDYTDFVSLSTKLVNVDGSLARMQRPLLELQAGAGVPLLGVPLQGAGGAAGWLPGGLVVPWLWLLLDECCQ